MSRPSRALRRSRRAAIVTAALAASAIVLVGGPTDAATLGASGWWWQANPGGSSLTPSPAPQVTTPGEVPPPPAPPDVPEGGLLVERTPERTTAVAAVRFTLHEDESNPVLELTAASTAGAPALLACQSGSAWSETAGGRWDSKPLAACDATTGGGSVAGVAGEGGTWTFNLAALAIDTGSGQEVDVVLVPPASPDPTSAAFRVVFEPVTAESLRTDAGAGDFSFDAGTGSSFGVGSGDGGAPAAGGFAPGSSFTTPGGVAVVSPDLPAEDQGLSATAPAIRNQTTPGTTAASNEPDDAGDKLAGVGAVLLAAAAALALTRQQPPVTTGVIAPRSPRHRALTAAAAPIAPRTAGLGRFVRQRTRPPVRL